MPESRQDLCELRAEAKYYCVDELAEAIEKNLKGKVIEEVSDTNKSCIHCKLIKLQGYFDFFAMKIFLLLL